MAQIEKQDRPREKLISKGQTALTDRELIQVIIGRGVQGSDVIRISAKIKRLLDIYGHKITVEQLLEIKGINQATATKLVALFELADRQLNKGASINTADGAVALVPELRDLKQEHLVVLSLDGANRLISKRTVSIGTLNSSLVHPREVFAEAITERAASVILIHNHPSGDTTPSQEDLLVTEGIAKAAKLLGIKLKDHIIITKDSHRSVLLTP